MRIKGYGGAREQEKKKEVQKGEIKKEENDGLIKVRVKERISKQGKRVVLVKNLFPELL